VTGGMGDTSTWMGQQVSEWQPIETAPKDGTEVLIYDPSYPKNPMAVDWYCPHDDTPGWLGTPTHWMPLPAPPQEPTLTDTIRAALEAAAKEVREAFIRPEGCGKLCEWEPCACARRGGAKGIAAFLRALPDHAAGRYGYELAAAVEEAAKEAGDG